MFDSSFLYAAIKANNHGALLFNNNSSCNLAENCIMCDTLPALEMNRSSGNIFAYCYAKDIYIGDSRSGFQMPAFYSNHDGHPYFNLIEGCYGSQIFNDGYHGSSSHNTYYRNLLHGTMPTASKISNTTNYHSRAISLASYSYWENIVGNILGHPGASTTYIGYSASLGETKAYVFMFGYSGRTFYSYSSTFSPPGITHGSQDNRYDLGVSNRVHIHANYDVATSTNGGVRWATGYDTTLDDSLYLTSKPAWWGNLTWPPFNPYAPNAWYDEDAIPAGYRYLNGTNPPPASDVTSPRRSRSASARVGTISGP